MSDAIDKLQDLWFAWDQGSMIGMADTINAIRPALDEMVKARAEIARLTAELAAVRAVPADVEAAMRHYGEVNSSPCWTAKGHADAEDALRTAIARAISDATAARGTVGGLLATAAECPTWCATHDPRDMATAMDGDRRYASPECRDAGRCLTHGPLPKGG